MLIRWLGAIEKETKIKIRQVGSLLYSKVAAITGVIVQVRILCNQ